MCGIVAYVGDRQPTDFLIEGLRRLEYRASDSAGIAVLDGDEIRVGKKTGRVQDLSRLLEADPLEGTPGIGHTRWATQGRNHRAHRRATSPDQFLF